MNKEVVIEKMIEEIETIEKEALVEKYSTSKAMQKDAVSRIYKKFQEVIENEN